MTDKNELFTLLVRDVCMDNRQRQEQVNEHAGSGERRHVGEWDECLKSELSVWLKRGMSPVGQLFPVGGSGMYARSGETAALT